MSDSELYQDVVNGNQPAFKKLYNRFWNKLYIFSFNILRNQEICEDIVQEIFVELWDNRKEKKIENVQAYLFKAVKFKTLNVIRNTAISAKHLGLKGSDQPRNTTEENLHYNELKQTIDAKIDLLPAKCKEVFIMSRYEQLSNKEIAERLDISVQTVKNQITKALSILREGIL